ncbi:E3 ubiquitin-protein ligase TRIM39-like [Trichomycterus rosablanca]|uniref:E3 ubiquitin-protein ligase TRIM39-like n=1 Tax=Trichomycterus rosablanca TaxID=2290929 RepID=UPI002F3580E6
MASSSSFLCEDQLQCSICLDVFTDPVSTPCGHNFCMICIKKYWDTSSTCQCPVCKESFFKRPDLRVNTFISGLALEFKKSVQVKSSSAAEQLPSKPKNVNCAFCTREKSLRSCLDCGVSYCNTHPMPHRTVAKLKRHKLIDHVENLEDYICQKQEKHLKMFCRHDQMCVCQKNLRKTQAEVQQMIVEHLNKIKKIKLSVELNQKNTEKEKADSMKVFRSLMSCIERNQAELFKVIEEKQRAAEHQAEEFIKDLKQEIVELKRKNAELEQISKTEDHLHRLQIHPSLCSPPPTKNWTDTKINPHLNVETLRRALSQLQETLNMEMEKIVEIELKKIQKHAVNVTLDPDTAHPKLILSEDGTQVQHGDNRQNLPDNPKRFNHCVNVLGKQRFSSGRFYYEVQVSQKTDWTLGVAKESINRRGMITLTPETGYWCMWLRNKTEYMACDYPRVLLTLKQAPQKVGVFVDYEEGLVSFYDVDARSHIYSFTDQSFTEKLYPYFSPCNHKEGKNSAPLVIKPTLHRIQNYCL